MKLRTNLNKYTLEFDEYHVISGLQKDLSAIDDQLLQVQTVYESLAEQVEDNQEVLANTPFSGMQYFHQEEHSLRMEKLELEERLKREAWEAQQAKLEKLEDKVQSLEDQNYSLKVKTTMKRSDYEQYQEFLKPFFDGQDIDIENVDRQKREWKLNEQRYRELSIQLQSMQKRANHDLKLQKKRQNDEQIKIELDIKSKYSHIEQTMAKLSVQNEEIRNMKELVKIFLLKKSGLKLSDLQSKESPSSSDIPK